MRTVEEITNTLNELKSFSRDDNLPAVIEEKLIETKKKKVGRKTVMTLDTLRKIEEVAALDGSVEEMASYAGIHKDTLYAYLKENKSFSDRLQALRERPVLKARNTVIRAIDEPQHAEWYLERKKRNEFSPKVEVDLTTRVLQIDI